MTDQNQTSRKPPLKQPFTDNLMDAILRNMSDAELDALTKCQSTKKDSYPDSDSAKAAAAILNQKPGRRLSAYQCRACDLWHIRRDRDANP